MPRPFTADEWRKIAESFPKKPDIEVEDWQSLHAYLDAWDFSKGWPVNLMFVGNEGRYIGTFEKLPVREVPLPD